jgi:hypothetical protein
MEDHSLLVKPLSGIELLPISVDINDYKQYVLSLDEPHWLTWTERQDLASKQGKHRHTQAIKIRWVPSTVSDTRLSYIETIEPYYSVTRKILKDLFDYLEQTYQGIAYRIMLTRLPSNLFIEPHYDNGYSLENIHRFHIPIITNDQCFFHCGTDHINMEEGSVYEINNQLTHSAVNHGPARIHMIIDIAKNSSFN